MNTTKHAEWNYMRRIMFLNEKQTEDHFRNFIKNEQELEKEIIEKIQGELGDAIYITFGKFGSYDETHFYLNQETLTIFVVDKDKSSILTCYKVDYDMSERSTKIIVDTLLKDIDNYKEEKESRVLDLKDNKNSLITAIGFADKEIDELKKRISILQEKRKTLHDLLELTDEDIDTLDYNIRGAESGIVNSFGFKKEKLGL